MEHLTFVPHLASQETRNAMWATLLYQDWTKIEDLMPFQKPVTAWLGFGHEDHGGYSDFENYPVLRDWKPHEIWKGNLRNAHPSLHSLTGREIARCVVAMLQSWFYHGLLEAVIEKHISVSYFVRQNTDSRTCIYSRNLYFCLYTWMVKKRQLERNDQVGESLRTLRALVLVSDWIKRLNTFTSMGTKYFHNKMESEYSGFGELVSSIIPSIIRLGEVIDCARLEAFGLLPSRLSWHYPQTQMMAQKQILKDDGWCPFILEYIDSTTTHSTIDWMTTLPKLPSGQDKEHRQCIEERCCRNDIDPETYIPTHDLRRCLNHNQHLVGRCSSVKPDLDRVLEILENGNIPVVSIKDDGELSLLSQSPLNINGDYVAISHMWADGLGSTTEDGIPICQARRLLDVARRATQTASPAIWIDSLCIPKEPVARHKAIILMKETYANACSVVVDNGLRRIRTSAMPEVLMCGMHASGWMQRLWTYQEAMLAKYLKFELEDGLYTMDPANIQRQGPTTPLVVAVVWRAIGARLMRLLDRKTEVRSIASVSKDLNWRSTSRSTDEVLALAGVLGLDPTLLPIDTTWQWYEQERSKGLFSVETLQLQKQEKMFILQEQRMALALVQIRRFPLDVLFLQGPKLGVHPFRWAPRTLMNRSGFSMSGEFEAHVARCDSNGLRGRWLVLSMNAAVDASAGTIVYVGSMQPTAVYRIFCKEWADQVDVSTFNTVILDGDINMPFGVGEIRQGLAVVKRSSVYIISGGHDSTIMCEAIGQVLVENLRLEEALDPNPSIMFAEPRFGEFISGELGGSDLYVT